MNPITKQALDIVEEFEKQISTLPAGEREFVLKRLTSHVSALNEDVTKVLRAITLNHPEAEETRDADHIRDYL